MALKFSQLLFLFFLWFSLFLLLFREFRNFKSKSNIAKQNTITAPMNNNLITDSSISNYNVNNNYHPLMSRKVLASSFDFTPFIAGHHKKRRRSTPGMAAEERSHDQASSGDRDHQSSNSANDHEIDPRYGVEKRRVPTGPNPLHH
ncbi:CLAVATA3/ESR (CLE)-related protein 12 [Humulus lupulus]|uniref:CLAVATA3/ESR (CLE)-related protein 12 n=1 Tax=Humulus lupulus TaxID=3486 RepID=UPI002B40E641|nr:CLAVATA3/ESR (CLE)-related protein 12 [Humulus lupulus]